MWIDTYLHHRSRYNRHQGLLGMTHHSYKALCHIHVWYKTVMSILPRTRSNNFPVNRRDLINKVCILKVHIQFFRIFRSCLLSNHDETTLVKPLCLINEQSLTLFLLQLATVTKWTLLDYTFSYTDEKPHASFFQIRIT